MTTRVTAGLIADGTFTADAAGRGKFGAGFVDPSLLAQPLTRMASQATTSGTQFDFNAIPSWARVILVAFEAVSLNGTNDLLVQIGTSGGIDATGYVSNSGGASSSTAGFVIRMNNATRAFRGVLALVNVSGNIWVSMHAGNTDSTTDLTGGGSKTLGGTLDRLRVTRTGSDTFDAGSVNVIYL